MVNSRPKWEDAIPPPTQARESKQTDEALHERQETELTSIRSALDFRLLLETMPAAAYTCDAEGLITYFNRRAVEVWRREPKRNDPGDRYCGSFRLFLPDGSLLRHDRCWMARCLQESKEHNGEEIVVERPDGSRLSVQAYATPFHDEQGKLAGAVNILVDITDRKRAEEALRETDRRKDQFLAMLAHELRNPLAPLRNAVQVLNLRSPPMPELEWARDVIDRQIQQMTRLIDDLLDVSRISSNKLELRRERVELAKVVRGAVETSRPLLEEYSHELTVTLPPEPILLNADLTRLAQVFSNLLNNAAKYTDKGGRIDLTVERQEKDVVVSVKDNGIGIAAAKLPAVFEMFAQIDGSLSRSQGGLGIGLSLVKRLVEMHGGSIEARSDGSGKGSEFRVRLPMVIERPPAPKIGNNNGATLACKLRILVVDSNQDAASSLAMLLKVLGNNVRTAGDGEEAMQAAAEFHPQVALLDINLPKRNGYDVARHLRQEPWGKSMVLIAVTSWGQDDDKRQVEEAGFDRHMVKPIDAQTLMKLLAELQTVQP